MADLTTYSFENLKVWQKAHQFVLAVYRVTLEFPDSEKFGLISQFRRAAVSITANIAEGYKKLSRADKLRFFNIAQGSLEECRNYIILSRDLHYFSLDDYENLIEMIEESSKLLNAYCLSVSENKALRDNV